MHSLRRYDYLVGVTTAVLYLALVAATAVKQGDSGIAANPAREAGGSIAIFGMLAMCVAGGSMLSSDPRSYPMYAILGSLFVLLFGAVSFNTNIPTIPLGIALFTLGGVLYSVGRWKGLGGLGNPPPAPPPIQESPVAQEVTD